MGARRCGAVVVAGALAGVLALAGCASLRDGGGGDPGGNPCDSGAPGTEVLGDPDLGVDGPSQEAMDWQAATEDLVPKLQAIAGERLGGLWLQWVPERAVVVRLTDGPELPALRQAADEAGVDVVVRDDAPVSRADLLAAAEALPDYSDLSGVDGMGVDEVNGRLAFRVASGDDGGASTCAALVERLAGIGVPYGFDVFEGSVEREVRGPTSFSLELQPQDGGDVLHLSVFSCNGEPEVTRLEEGVDEVRIEVTSTTPGPGRSGDGCLDLLDVTLQAPLGDRALIDLSRGVVVEVS